jgi:hypothetical protein
MKQRFSASAFPKYLVFFATLQLSAFQSSTHDKNNTATDAPTDQESLRFENINDLNSDTFNEIKNAISNIANDEDNEFKHLLDLERVSAREQTALGDLCTNYRSLSKEERLNVWVKFLIAQGLVESSFNRNATDVNDNHRPRGFWQISHDSRNHPPKLDKCDFKRSDDELRNNIHQNVECIFSFFELRHKNGMHVYGSTRNTFEEFWDSNKPENGKHTTAHALHWSVLREGDKFESKFAPVFGHIVPECRMDPKLIEKINSTSLACRHVGPFLKFKKLPGTNQSLNYPDDKGPFHDNCS